MSIDPYDSGTFFILRINEPTLSDSTKQILSHIRPLGVHFGADAFRNDLPYSEWLAALIGLRKEISEACEREAMIWALDHEGGRVHRVPAPITHFSYPLNWEHRASNIGAVVGTELCSLGVNVLFGPVLDIYSNASNLVIGPRSFGRGVTSVIDYGLPYIDAVQTAGVACVGKHFPGHGDTELDSHFHLPVLHADLSSLMRREIEPFAKAFAGGLNATMLAHILFPRINPSLPSSLAPEFTIDLLRDRLGFQGVAISDDIDMKSVRDHFSLPELSRLLLEAQLDLIIVNHDLNGAQKLCDMLGTEIKKAPHRRYALQRAARVQSFFDSLDHPTPHLLGQDFILAHSALSTRVPEHYNVQVEEFDGQ
ncbi:MAG: hypothetical protein KJO82_04200 [Gammaproteobacteria bacterium]|nr:hypothetical protein [Gammaproteobacteria bacterium]